MTLLDQLYEQRRFKDICATSMLSYTQKELSDTIIDLASGKIDAEDILQWIISHQK